MSSHHTRESLSALRERIHRKSHEYFAFEYRRRERAKWHLFYGATDALLDAHTAAGSYGSAIGADTGVNLLACYGFLQALYVQQDAVRTLSRAVGLDWHPNTNKRLKEIRQARNRLTGHPSLAGEKDKFPRLSSAIIPYQDITKDGFRGHVYYHDGNVDVMVDAILLLKDNEEHLALQMQAVEKKMDEEERQFRTRYASHFFSSLFENPFSYLLQRLHCDLTNEDRVIQALTHAKMIRDRIDSLRVDLMNRDLGSREMSDDIDRILTGIDLLERIMTERSSSKADQHELDLVYDGVVKNIAELKTAMVEIDTKLHTPIP
jgi:hypothetical protein